MVLNTASRNISVSVPLYLLNHSWYNQTIYIREVWEQQYYGSAKSTFEVNVEAHSAFLFRAATERHMYIPKASSAKRTKNWAKLQKMKGNHLARLEEHSIRLQNKLKSLSSCRHAGVIGSHAARIEQTIC